ncbi:MAG: S-adenosyl-l-methionine hydroxide adenosyltransferase family protein [bacterium]
MEHHQPLVALVTDFGWEDPFVAEIKLQIWQVNPYIHILDITHHLPPGDIVRGAYIIGRVVERLPQRSVLLGVVDPGVGSSRQGVVIAFRERYLVGPDNGLFSYSIPWSEKFSVRILSQKDVRNTISPTFHGRDLFAPIAARLAVGEDVESFGEEGELQNTFPPPPPVRVGKIIYGKVLYIDRFGNLATNLPASFSGTVKVKGAMIIHQVRCYADLAPGKVGWLIGSDGKIELAANRERADRILGINIGEELIFEIDQEESTLGDGLPLSSDNINLKYQ